MCIRDSRNTVLSAILRQIAEYLHHLRYLMLISSTGYRHCTLYHYLRGRHFYITYQTHTVDNRLVHTTAAFVADVGRYLSLIHIWINDTVQI